MRVGTMTIVMVAIILEDEEGRSCLVEAAAIAASLALSLRRSAVPGELVYFL